MASVDHAEPADVVDRLLWRDAQYILKRHAGPNDDGMCAWCSRRWPCGPRRLAERAQEAALKPSNDNRLSEPREIGARTPEPRNRRLFD